MAAGGAGETGGRAPRAARAPRGRTRGARRAALLPGEGPLTRVPAVAAFAIVAAVFAAGVVIGGLLGAALLGLLALGVAGLLAATWPRLSPAERLGRMLVLAVLVAIAIGLAGG